MNEQQARRLVSSSTRMDSLSPINFRAAQATAAYTNHANGARPAQRPSQATSNSTAAPAAGSLSASGMIVPPLARQTADANPMRIGRRPDAIAPNLASMVAGQVDSPVGQGAGFEAPSSPTARPTAPAGYAMYTRAADRVEVATGLSVGRTLDARG